MSARHSPVPPRHRALAHLAGTCSRSPAATAPAGLGWLAPPNATVEVGHMAQALVQYEHRHPLGDREDLVALLDRVVGCDDPGVVAARCLSRLDLVELGALPVRPDPVARDGERALARFGLLGEGAAPAFAPGAKYPLTGLLPGDTGLLACARTVYGRLRNGFYGLETMLVMLVFCARLREPRAEGATRVSLAALGRVLGLDRAPEVKTIRRKLGELAAAGRAEQLQMAIARHHAAARPDQLGVLLH